MTGCRHNLSTLRTLDRLHADILCLSPTDTGSFFDENTNQLQWNRSTCNTPAPLVPDTTPITFGLEMGLTNELPFFDGFSHASCDLGSLFGHESDSANWNSGWSGENCRELRNEYMSLPSSSDYLAILPPELEALLATADPSLALGGVSAAVDSPPLHLWGSDDLPVSSSKATAFLINVTHIPNLDPDTTVDALLKDQDVHSWGGSTGGRSKVDAYVPGIFFGCADPEVRIACRRSKPKCCGAYSCESLASEFTNVERRELDPNSRDRLVEAQLRTREIQDSSRMGQVLSFIKSISDWRCGAVDSTTNRVCSGGKAVPKKLAQVTTSVHLS
ncbi:hypothetical protein B0H10DRAFT_2075745 [Mycena sp. CBHHK59/15]|nr:hypothetical protein B0H10DRAFT_2075745 [Mycena sp. CBHHK59/15]